MLQIILLLLSGVLSTEGWNVMHPLSICGVRGSNVTIPCNFTYPTNKTLQVTEVSWCSRRENKECDTEVSYVYNSSHTNIQSNFQYIGDKISNCSLLISNINSTSSGEYLFRFITSWSKIGYTSKPGATVTVTDLKVSIIKLGEKENIKVGDSLNLTCTVPCPGYLPELQWFKDHKTIQHSGPILTFSNVTLKDSGNYSCSLRNFKSSESEQIRLYVEGSVFPDTGFTTFFWVVIIGVCLVSVIFIVAAVILITRPANTEQQMKDSTIYSLLQ